MSQKKTNKKRQAPAYSADTLALRLIAGLALVALGGLIFLAAVIRMNGDLFEGLRLLCYGFTGGLTVVLPVIPVWGGVLVILSTQRRVRVKPFVFASLAFLGLSAFVMLISRYGSSLLMDRIDELNRTTLPYTVDWTNAVSRAFDLCGQKMAGGGALGEALAWPLFKPLGSFLAGVIFFFLTAFCLLMVFGLTPRVLMDWIKGEGLHLRKERNEDRRAQSDRNIAWQQEQARQQAILQQQAYMQQQYEARMREEAEARQMQQQARNGILPGQPYNTEQRQAFRPPRDWSPDQNSPVSQPPRQPAPWQGNGVESFQEQVNTENAGKTSLKSRLFSHGAPVSEAPRQVEAPNPVFTRAAEPAASFTNPLPADRSVRTRETSAPEHGKFRRASGTAERAVPEITEWPSRKQPEPEPVPETRPVEPEPTPVPETRPVEPEPETPARTFEPVAFEKPAEPVKREEPEQLSFVSEPAPVRPRLQRPSPVPKVQQETKKDAWNPELKLPPSETPPDADREDDIYTPVPYNTPLITNLKLPAPSAENTAAEDAFRSQRLEETLGSFRVQAKVMNVTHGPAISRFELELAPGTKVSKINELEKDIAYGMEATSVRIEAPIPGKSLVGVEVPNRKVATVTLREVLESDRMQNAKSILTVALGKDIAGTPIVCDLAKMPHMLIAGATGSGKSVCINAIINSLLYRAGPDEVRLILVDPKVVELQCYNGIPHLLIPVVNDPHKASAALAWAVAEMMDRYDKFARAKVRALDSYNASLGPNEKPMPRIVIIIDELADLMMVCKKDVEEYICRLTQLARAAGIHLIVATQRPSVDVITGLIKANIPSRIAFKTASYVDSRTILDRNGSEQLLGWGDMLYLPTGSFAPTRVQGCFLSDDEVNAIVSDVRRNNPSSYDPDVLEQLEQITHEKETPVGADMISGVPAESGDSDRDLFEQAVEMAIQDGQISTSTLQRRLKIGYSRAGRLTDELEERGIVAQKDGSKPRKCLITREEWEKIKQTAS